MKNYHKYLPVTETEKQWGFYVTTVGCSQVKPGEAYPPSHEHPSSHIFTWNKGRILDGYYLVFISSGKGIFESDQTVPSVITEGTCFFLFPGIWHRYKPDIKTGWEEYWVGFKGSYPDYLMNKGFFNPVKPFIHTGLDESLLSSYQCLIENVLNSHHGYHQIIPGITLEMLGMVYKLSLHEKMQENATHQLIDKAMFLLRESVEEEIDMLKLAQKLPMGYSKFRKEFKAVTGLAPHQYLLTHKISKAKELLQSTNLSINEIAYQTGFESVFYFSKLFKKRNGVSPKSYRQTWR
ncbi:MAG: helix-turn-helix domain-containing protein [Chitinophagaceae bacterium]